MTKVLSFISAKGGVAKTTVTIDVAALLHKKGYNVLVMDLDENCSLSANIGADYIDNKQSMYEILTSDGDIDLNSCIQHLEVFDLITGSKSLSKLITILTGPDDKYRLQDVIEVIKNIYSYDFILIDNSPSRSLLLTMTYIASDYIVIPTLCDDCSTNMVYSAENDLMQLKNSRDHLSHAEVLGYLLTYYQANTNMCQVALEKLKGMADEKEPKPFVKTISYGISMSEVKSYHTSVNLLKRTDKTSKIQDDYEELVRELLKRMGDEK